MNNKLIIGMCLVSALLIGVILSITLTISSVLIGNVWIYAIVTFFALGFILYYALKHFTEPFFFTLPLSVIVAAGSWVGEYISEKLIELIKHLASQNMQEGMTMFIGNTFVSPLIMTLFIIIGFNTLPLIKLIKK